MHHPWHSLLAFGMATGEILDAIADGWPEMESVDWERGWSLRAGSTTVRGDESCLIADCLGSEDFQRPLECQ